MTSTIASPAARPAQKFLGLAPLLRQNLAGTDLTPLCQALIAQATNNPDDAGSLLDAGIIFQFHDNLNLALKLQQEALNMSRHYWIPAARPARLRLLALMAPGDLMANVPVECLLEDSDVELHIYYASADEFNPEEIPEHDVLFVAISETEANRPILHAWLPLLAEWPKPILNPAQNIERIARDYAAELLAALPGVVIPPTLRVDRSLLRQLAAGESPATVLETTIAFPLLVRPLDSHAGHDLHKVDSATQLADILDQQPDQEFFVSAFVDYRSADGQFRKYRIILVDGQPFICHMGISDHWMIHYLNAGMADNAEKRAEEARFMADFDTGFAPRHGAALSAIGRSIGLDYLGIDCAETVDGELLIFEVDHAMVVHAMDPVDVYPYKQAVMHKLFAAFRAMLFKAAGKDLTVAE